jgi:hypothetical protein
MPSSTDDMQIPAIPTPLETPQEEELAEINAKLAHPRAGYSIP